MQILWIVFVRMKRRSDTKKQNDLRSSDFSGLGTNEWASYFIEQHTSFSSRYLYSRDYARDAREALQLSPKAHDHIFVDVLHLLEKSSRESLTKFIAAGTASPKDIIEACKAVTWEKKAWCSQCQGTNFPILCLFVYNPILYFNFNG